MIRVYVASRWQDGPDLVRDVVDRLESAEWACTHRWWTEAPSEHVAGWAANGDRDLRGVAAADLVVVLATTGSGGTGMWIEMGYALGLNKPILLWAPEAHRDFLRPSLSEVTSPFAYAPGVRRWCSDADVLLDRVVEEAAQSLGEEAVPPEGWFRCPSCGGRWARGRWDSRGMDAAGVMQGEAGTWCPAGVCTAEDRKAAIGRRG